MDKQNITVLRKILYAVESGDQIYGRQDYSCFAGAGANCDNETAITIGAGQWYAGEAKELLHRIQRANPKLFKDMDNAGMESDLLMKNWDTYAVTAESAKGQCIISIISTDLGKKCQDEYMEDQIKAHIPIIEKAYGIMPDSAMMECINILHQGGFDALKRVLSKTLEPYTVDKIYATLCQDPTDPTPNQVGDYTDRQKAVINMIRTYADSIDKEEGVEMTKTEKAIRQMETWAKDDSHGYDQDYRWGEKGDYDCSSAVIQAWQNAGVPVKSGGATYTGDMKNVFLKNGFKDITASVNRGTGTGLKRGDVLLNEVHHVAMYGGAGNEVEASINEKGTAHGGQPGDQTGKEFLIRSYRNYPWNCILRYAGDTVTSDAEKKQNAVAYVARFTKDCKCYSAAGKTQAKMFPVIKKNAVVDVMKYTETVKGKKWYFIRIPHPTEGFVFEFVPAGYFKKLV